MAPAEMAIAQAKQAGAQVVVMGKVTSYRSGATLNGFSTVRLISVDSGEVLASFHRPSGLLIGNSEHQGVLAAVKRTAEDVAKALR
jgi:curli biogenesis system outer membrane secretion channel CsgG